MQIDSSLLAPGFSVTGKGGKDGEQGDIKSSIYFTNFDLTDLYNAELAKGRILSNQTLSNTSSESIENHPYIDGDIFISNANEKTTAYRLIKNDDEISFELLGNVVNSKDMSDFGKITSKRISFDGNTSYDGSCFNTDYGKSMNFKISSSVSFGGEELQNKKVFLQIDIKDIKTDVYGLNTEYAKSFDYYKTIEIPLVWDPSELKYRGEIVLRDWVCDKLHTHASTTSGGYNPGFFFTSSSTTVLDASFSGGILYIEDIIGASSFKDKMKKTSILASGKNRTYYHLGESNYFSKFTEVTETPEMKEGGTSTSLELKAKLCYDNTTIYRLGITNISTGETLYKEYSYLNYVDED